MDDVIDVLADMVLAEDLPLLAGPQRQLRRHRLPGGGVAAELAEARAPAARRVDHVAVLGPQLRHRDAPARTGSADQHRTHRRPDLAQRLEAVPHATRAAGPLIAVSGIVRRGLDLD